MDPISMYPNLVKGVPTPPGTCIREDVRMVGRLFADDNMKI